MMRVAIDPPEAFDQAQVLAGASELHLVVEVRRFDDERVAFEATARIALPLADAVRHVRTAIERNHAHRAAHLGVDDDVGRRLDDLVVAVVADARQERRSADREPQAALVQRPCLRVRRPDCCFRCAFRASTRVLAEGVNAGMRPVGPMMSEVRRVDTMLRSSTQTPGTNSPLIAASSVKLFAARNRSSAVFEYSAASSSVKYSLAPNSTGRSSEGHCRVGPASLQIGMAPRRARHGGFGSVPTRRPRAR